MERVKGQITDGVKTLMGLLRCDTIHKGFPFKYTSWLLALLMASLHPTLHDLANSIYTSILLACLHICPIPKAPERPHPPRCTASKQATTTLPAVWLSDAKIPEDVFFPGFN